MSTQLFGTEIAGMPGRERPHADAREMAALGNRRLAVYPASNGYDLVAELEHLAARAIEPNIFYAPRFLAPAMPRLEDREVRLAVMRDMRDATSRLRMLAPFFVSRPVLRVAPPVIRVWASPYGPLGTPLVDRDDPHGTVADFLRLLADPQNELPSVIEFPELRTDGVFAAVLQSAAADMNLPVTSVLAGERAMLRSDLDGEAYLKGTLGRHRRDYARLERRLAETGTVVYDVATTPDETRVAAETFLALEASGWKGRAGTAMVVDRMRAAFLREAISGLSERGMCRIHTLAVGGQPVASLIVLVDAGVAYTWKTAYDEAFAPYAPGVLLMIEVTNRHLDDLNVSVTDSCAAPGHPLMNRLWSERAPMATLVVGLRPGTDRLVNAAARALEREAALRSNLRGVRQRLRRWLAR